MPPQAGESPPAKGGQPTQHRACPQCGSIAEDAGFEPARAVNPTRVPGERHRPLGESSVAMVTERAGAAVPPPVDRPEVLDFSKDPARRLSCELPQGRKAARVNGLCRVRGVPLGQRKEPLESAWCHSIPSAPMN